MIVFDGDDNSSATPAIQVQASEKTGRDVLFACAAEAMRHASELTGLDAALGAALTAETDNGWGLDPTILQKVDLLRQEAEGLSCVLKLLSRQQADTAVVDNAELSACLPTAKQRNRLLGT